MRQGVTKQEGQPAGRQTAATQAPGTHFSSSSHSRFWKVRCTSLARLGRGGTPGQPLHSKQAGAHS